MLLLGSKRLRDGMKTFKEVSDMVVAMMLSFDRGSLAACDAC
jgi:hypothetical protein